MTGIVPFGGQGDGFASDFAHRSYILRADDQLVYRYAQSA
jgi:hypothetical protein